MFKIGVSPIGTISSFDPWVTVLSQYANSPILTAIITSFNAAVDQTQELDNFYDFIWNVATAQGYGLDVWGRIVGVSRVVQIPGGSNTHFGFNEPGDPTDVGFGQAPFFTGDILTTNVVLVDYDFRRLILAKASANISDGSILSINSILLALFPNRGDCYVRDGQNMTMTYYFAFILTPTEKAIIQNSLALPPPSGVVVSVVSPP